MKRMVLQPAYVLHRRPYRETSFLLEFFTEEFGRISTLAKGVRKAQSGTQGLLQPFMPLLISCSGKGELLNLVQVEANGPVKLIQGECLFAGFYMNELLVSLLEKWDAHPGLYHAYVTALSGLENNVLDEKILRIFEKKLLEELGYGLFPKTSFSTQYVFLPDQYYHFSQEQGFQLEEQGDTPYSFKGQHLLNMINEDWQAKETLQDAKRLHRFILASLLGSKKINSRHLFQQLEEEMKHEEQ